MDSITYHPIGVIHSPFKETAGMPIQAAAAVGVSGTIDLEPAFAEGLVDIAGFSHLILLYHFHLARETNLTVTPFLDDRSHGIFATRAPTRPNPIGLSIVALVAVNGATLAIADVDVVDGTPLLDVKPWVPEFDVRTNSRIGWMGGQVGRMRQVRSS
jgi:tRNA-Thr(GGU) m(6)t(6)A37 methyltransferase TsaA